MSPMAARSRTDLVVVAALHEWFEAQLSDHGSHAKQVDTRRAGALRKPDGHYRIRPVGYQK